MDKAEYQSRLEELNSLVKKEDYEGALAVVEAVDWRRVKSLRTLGMVADVYEANKRYPEAKKILLMAYDRSSIGKGILYRLVEVSVKMKDFDEAIDFYNEFEAVARHDNSRYLLKYKIFRKRRLRSRFPFWRNTKSGNLPRDGHMNWQTFTAKPERRRNASMPVMS